MGNRTHSPGWRFAGLIGLSTRFPVQVGDGDDWRWRVSRCSTRYRVTIVTFCSTVLLNFRTATSKFAFVRCLVECCECLTVTGTATNWSKRYFQIDTARTAGYLGLPYAYPDPSPIRFKSGSLWVPEDEQPLNEYLYRLYVGAVQAGKGIEFLEHVGRMIWDGSTSGWDKGNHLALKMTAVGLELADVLTATPWETAKSVLDVNAEAMIEVGHWGVPLMVYRDEPFYGQDRFEQMIWRMRADGDVV